MKHKKSCFNLLNNFNLGYYFLNFYLPNDWNTVIVKKNLKKWLFFYFFSYNYFFLLPVPSKFVFVKFDNQLNLISFKFLYNNNFYSLFLLNTKRIFKSFFIPFFKKLKFRGKGYYIYKNIRNTIALQFGYSHLMYLYSYFTSIKFLTKTTIFVFGINFYDINFTSISLYNIKKINIFTGKGIRFSRQLLYKKTGKISSYR